MSSSTSYKLQLEKEVPVLQAFEYFSEKLLKLYSVEAPISIREHIGHEGKIDTRLAILRKDTSSKIGACVTMYHVDPHVGEVKAGSDKKSDLFTLYIRNGSDFFSFDLDGIREDLESLAS